MYYVYLFYKSLVWLDYGFETTISGMWDLCSTNLATMPSEPMVKSNKLLIKIFSNDLRQNRNDILISPIWQEIVWQLRGHDI